MNRLGWGLVGGGEDSQIGFAHRAGAELDRKFLLTAGALDFDPGRGRAFGISLGLHPERSYGDWREMLRRESSRPDRVDLVTIATPNATHFEISKAFLEAGFHVLCEKPLTITQESATELERIARDSGKICAVNFGYTGYPLVRQMRAMVENGDLGRIRVVKSEFAGGFLADAADNLNPRVRWRFDPAHAGISCAVADLGSHAMHLAEFVSGQRIVSVSADFVSGIKGRKLEDDAFVAFRMSGGTAGRLWVSGLAIGRTHGLTIQVFGEKGGLQWSQEQPNQLRWTPLSEPTRILEKGSASLSSAASQAARIAEGHPEGMVFAFANIYTDLADAISSAKSGQAIRSSNFRFPTVEDGRQMVDMVFASAASAKRNGEWINVGDSSE